MAVLAIVTLRYLKLASWGVREFIKTRVVVPSAVAAKFIIIGVAVTPVRAGVHWLENECLGGLARRKRGRVGKLNVPAQIHQCHIEGHRDLPKFLVLHVEAVFVAISFY